MSRDRKPTMEQGTLELALEAGVVAHEVYWVDEFKGLDLIQRESYMPLYEAYLRSVYRNPYMDARWTDESGEPFTENVGAPFVVVTREYDDYGAGRCTINISRKVKHECAHCGHVRVEWPDWLLNLSDNYRRDY